MMAFDLHAALLLLLAFALGGALAFLLRRRAEHRKMSYLAQATLLSLDDEPGEPPAVPQSAPPAPSAPAPVAADPALPAAPPPPPDPALEAACAPPPRAARQRRAGGPKVTAERPRPQVPQEMVPLAPADPELPLGLPAPPAPAKPKRPRARPAPERGMPSDTVAAPAANDTPVAAAAGGTAGTPPPLLPAPEGAADDLKRLKGIGPQNERRLNALGIYHLRQIAAWSPEEVRWVGATLAFPGRIEREAWVAQAKALLDGGAPEAP